MNMHWSPTLKDAIRNVLEHTEQEGGILDAYAAAAKIQRELPEENVALEDIISALLRGRGSIKAIEFSPPSAGILEIVMPGLDDQRTPSANEDAVLAPR